MIIPDGQLHLLPFSALVNKDATMYFRRTPWMLRHPLLRLRSLRGSRKRRERAEMPYIGVAAWTQKADHRNPILRAVSGPERSEFVPLPYSKAEVETIAHDLPSPNTILLGADATETRFKQLSTESAEVIHLALHGYADVDYPDRSALIFAPEANGPGRRTVAGSRNSRTPYQSKARNAFRLRHRGRSGRRDGCRQYRQCFY